MHPALAIVVLWGGFVLSWILAAVWRSPAEKSVGWRSEIDRKSTRLNSSHVD